MLDAAIDLGAVEPDESRDGEFDRAVDRFRAALARYVDRQCEKSGGFRRTRKPDV